MSEGHPVGGDQNQIDAEFNLIIGNIRQTMPIAEQIQSLQEIKLRQEHQRDETNIRTVLLEKLPPNAKPDSLTSNIRRVVLPGREEFLLDYVYVTDESDGMLGRESNSVVAAYRRQTDGLLVPGSSNGFTISDAEVLSSQVDELLDYQRSTLPNLTDDLTRIYDPSKGSVIDSQGRER